jgi:hypothetical protein
MAPFSSASFAFLSSVYKLKIYLFHPIQRVAAALSLGVKRPEREADHSPPSSAEVKECVELCLHSPNMSSWSGAQLKHRDNFTFMRVRNLLFQHKEGTQTEGD